MRRITITLSDSLYEQVAREAAKRGQDSAADYIGALVRSAIGLDAADFTRCDDERFLLDPGGGLALAEDYDDQDLKEETRPWRRGRSGRRTGR